MASTPDINSKLRTLSILLNIGSPSDGDPLSYTIVHDDSTFDFTRGGADLVVKAQILGDEGFMGVVVELLAGAGRIICYAQATSINVDIERVFVTKIYGETIQIIQKHYVGSSSQVTPEPIDGIELLITFTYKIKM